MENETQTNEIPQEQPQEQPDQPIPSAQESIPSPQPQPKKPKRWLTVGSILVALSIFGVGVLFASGKIPFKKETPPPTPSPTPTSLPEPPISDEAKSQLAESHNQFGFKLLQNLTAKDTGQNLFISPTSMALALSMTLNGAQGETKEAMSQTLEVQDLTLESLNQASRSFLDWLKNPDQDVQLAVANSIWAKQGIKFNPEFMNDNQNYYQAQITSLDLTDPRAAQMINDWVSQNTNAKIPNIVQPPIGEDIVMYLINAIYFKGVWTKQFDPQLTRDRQFTSVYDLKKLVPMMEQKETFPYLENDQFQAVSLPYGKNQRLKMDLFLPKNDLTQFIQSLKLEQWNQWLAQFQETEGTIILPKFKIEYEKELNDTLKALGMAIAFDPDQANFGRMANLDELLGNLFISKVKHKSFVEVNEEGTEAAAATSVEIGITAIREEPTFFMEINRPFFFAIRDTQTEAILFMGAIQSL